MTEQATRPMPQESTKLALVARSRPTNWNSFLDKKLKQGPQVKTRGRREGGLESPAQVRAALHQETMPDRRISTEDAPRTVETSLRCKEDDARKKR